MHVFKKYCCFVLLSFFPGFALADVPIQDEVEVSKKEKFNLLFVDYKPLMYRENGQIKGEVGELTMAVFKRAGYEVQILDDVPFRRVFQVLATGLERTCGTGWYKTPERERFAVFTQAINVAVKSVVVARKDDQALIESYENIESLLRARELKTARVNGVSGGPFYDELVAATKPNAIMVQRFEQQLRLLSANRIDYFLAENSYIENVSQQASEAREFVSIDLPGMPIGESRYIACSKNTSMADINRLNAAIEYFAIDKPEL